jgi:antirestriction protein ArdC
MSNAEVYQAVTDRMIAQLEAGTVPWQRPWVAGTGRPRSMTTRKPYQGINVLLLGLTAMERGYTSPWWGTMNQVNELGGRVRKGQNKANGCGATVIYLWKSVTKTRAGDDGEPVTTRFPVARAFYVFNADQCEGLPERFYPQPGAEPEIMPEPESILADYTSGMNGPELAYGGDSAHYQPGPDLLTLPVRAAFADSEKFYAVAFHEVTHSTGHASRCGREGLVNFDHFGSERYAREELTAEMGSAMLCAIAGIETAFANSAAYIASWLRALRDDRTLVSRAATEAGRAVDYILAAGAATETADDAELVAA